ncbi:MAG: hypothetical protein ABIJ12_05315 [bacterium]
MKIGNKFSFLFILLFIVIIAGCGGDKGNDPVNPANKIITLNGVYYKGTMGSNILDKKLQFAVTDSDGKYIPDQQIQLAQFDGDGTIPRSAMTDSTGIAEFEYEFSGTESVARILLQVDTIRLEIHIRADALIPGAGGQASYVLLSDRYSGVKNYLGEPASVDIVPGDHQIIYANYENALGVVVMLYDQDLDKTVYDTSSVYGVIVNTKYDVMTPTTPPIGIGSTLDDLRSAYGAPDTIFHEDPRPATVVRYSSLPGVFYCHWQFGMTDTLIEEIHFIDP